MRTQYENALQIMLSGDEGLAQIIQKFVDSFPEKLRKKIEAKKEKGTVISESGKHWVFEDLGNELCISVGNPGTHKDYMNLYLNGVSNDTMKSWPRFESEKLVGYLTIYLHNPANHKEKPLQVNYDFYAKRFEKKVYMTISTRFNSSIKGYEEKLDEKGLTEVHKRIVGKVYEINTKGIVENRNATKA